MGPWARPGHEAWVLLALASLTKREIGLCCSPAASRLAVPKQRGAHPLWANTHLYLVGTADRCLHLQSNYSYAVVVIV